jgi:hypothetical protein
MIDNHFHAVLIALFLSLLGTTALPYHEPSPAQGAPRHVHAPA